MRNRKLTFIDYWRDRHPLADFWLELSGAVVGGTAGAVAIIRAIEWIAGRAGQ